MQDPNFIGIIGSPFIYDDYQRNNGYPVIESVEYFINAPQGPGTFRQEPLIMQGQGTKILQT